MSKSAGRRGRRPQLTERDVEILRWMTRHGVVTAELVGQRFFWRTKQKTYGKRVTYYRLSCMEHLGLIIRNKPYAHHPEIIRVTREGARIANVGLRPAPLVLSQLRHSLDLVLLVEGLAYQTKGEYLTERELRAERYRLRNQGEDMSRGRCPDALLSIPTKGAGAQGIKRVALELDLSRKSRAAMEEMIDRYDREDEIDAVWWYVAPIRVERTKAVVADMSAEDRFEVREWRART